MKKNKTKMNYAKKLGMESALSPKNNIVKLNHNRVAGSDLGPIWSRI